MKEPVHRPTAEAALQQWLKLRQAVGFIGRAQPLKPSRHRVTFEVRSRSTLELLEMMFDRVFWKIARIIRFVH